VVTAAPAVELRDVAIEYKRRIGKPVMVVSGVNLWVSDCESLCLVGRSGSGKSSLMLVAAGLMPPAVGSVQWAGTSVGELDPRAREVFRLRHIALVLQSGALIGTLTARENIGLAGIASGRSKHDDAEVDEILHALDLTAVADRFPSELSGGEQQRTAVARGLLAKAGVLLLDEPTANLDRESSRRLVEHLVTIRNERAIMIASHDPMVIESCDRVFNLEEV
jgi:putative ABC transport system ATP-binding protein